MLDSNIFVYAYDPTDPRKQSLALALVERQVRDGSLVVSAQVLNEFYYRATRPNRPPAISHEAAASIVLIIVDAALVLPLTVAVTLRAVDAVGRHGLSFWDVLIWAAARVNGVEVIYTEDVPGAPEIEGVRYINPFRDDAAG